MFELFYRYSWVNCIYFMIELVYENIFDEVISMYIYIYVY